MCVLGYLKVVGSRGVRTLAGRSKRARLADELEKRTREEWPDEPMRTSLDYAVHWVESGRTLLALVKDIGEELNEPVFRASLTEYLNAKYGDIAAVRLVRARQQGAHGLADDTLTIADEVFADSEHIAKARLQTDVRNRLAAAWNRDEFGQAKAGAVSVSIQMLHLDALRQPMATITITQPTAQLESGEPDVEILP